MLTFWKVDYLRRQTVVQRIPFALEIEKFQFQFQFIVLPVKKTCKWSLSASNLYMLIQIFSSTSVNSGF